jgi:hypothetical protein
VAQCTLYHKVIYNIIAKSASGSWENNVCTHTLLFFVNYPVLIHFNTINIYAEKKYTKGGGLTIDARLPENVNIVKQPVSIKIEN